MLADGDFVTSFLFKLSQPLEQEALFMKMPFSHLSKFFQCLQNHWKFVDSDNETSPGITQLPVELWALLKSCSFGWRHLASFIHSLGNLFKILAQLRSQPPKNHKKTALCFSLAAPRLKILKSKCLKQISNLPSLVRPRFSAEETLTEQFAAKADRSLSF